ncbi:MAG: hypothetical protein LBT71_09685 [Azoarcus sp.]|jgi:cell division septation protein DedD|nr:hypothetical protein [Azoarcus sp.]
MTTLRFLFILFLLLDILAFAAARGWLGLAPRPDETDPERATRQIYPERIKVLGQTPQSPSATIAVSQPPQPPAAPQAQQQAKICLSWSGLSTAQGNRLTALLRTAGIQTKTRDIETPTSWKVRTPPLPTREAAEILAGNIVELGIAQETLLIEETSAKKYAISLGVFSNRANAMRHLENVRTKGVNADIEVRNAVERHIEAIAAPAKAEAALTGQPYVKHYKPCQP